MQYKTSTLLSLKFTLYVLGLLFLLGLVINIGNTMQWFHMEQQELRRKKPLIEKNIYALYEPTERYGIKTKRLMSPKQENTFQFPFTRELWQTLQTNRIYKNISMLEEHIYVLYLISPDQQYIYINNITHHRDKQINQLRIWFFSLLCFVSITYRIARYFVKSSLSELWNLERFVQHIDTHKLEHRLPLIGPKDDELRHISQAINTFLDSMQQQTNALKEFVSFASHELKTPLMAMNTHLDLTLKTQDFGNFIPKQKSLLQRINMLFEQLLLMTRGELYTMQAKEVDLVLLIQEVLDEMQQRFPDIALNLIYTHPSCLVQQTDETLVRSIMTNLLSNVYKNIDTGNDVYILLDDQKILIQDTGKGINPADIFSIWQKFWKKGGDGLGLGLALVKVFVEKLGWHIELTSTLGVGTMVTIMFKNLGNSLETNN